MVIHELDMQANGIDKKSLRVLNSIIIHHSHLFLIKHHLPRDYHSTTETVAVRISQRFS